MLLLTGIRYWSYQRLSTQVNDRRANGSPESGIRTILVICESFTLLTFSTTCRLDVGNPAERRQMSSSSTRIGANEKGSSWSLVSSRIEGVVVGLRRDTLGSCKTPAWVCKITLRGPMSEVCRAMVSASVIGSGSEKSLMTVSIAWSTSSFRVERGTPREAKTWQAEGWTVMRSW